MKTGMSMANWLHKSITSMISVKACINTGILKANLLKKSITSMDILFQSHLSQEMINCNKSTGNNFKGLSMVTPESVLAKRYSNDLDYIPQVGDVVKIIGETDSDFYIVGKVGDVPAMFINCTIQNQFCLTNPELLEVITKADAVMINALLH